MKVKMRPKKCLMSVRQKRALLQVTYEPSYREVICGRGIHSKPHPPHKTTQVSLLTIGMTFHHHI